MKRLALAIGLAGLCLSIVPASASFGGFCWDQFNQCIEYYCNTISHPDCLEICDCQLRQCNGQYCL